MKELVIISGKGGTGKTSVTASFALLADRPVVADCDVDASDLHLLLSPTRLEQHDFYSGREAIIRPDACINCGICQAECRFDAVRSPEEGGTENYSIDPLSCEGCGVCVLLCPVDAINFPERLCGEWMVSESRAGPMVHARLDAGGENSGRLVAEVRSNARRIAQEKGRSLVIVDGPPGVGCAVIASVTGASMVLVVVEPTLSGEHDMERVLGLAKHFSIPAAISLNKWDLNREMSDRIESRARKLGAQVASRIRYDHAVVQAQMEAKAVVEIEAPAAEEIRNLWREIESALLEI